MQCDYILSRNCGRRCGARDCSTHKNISRKASDMQKMCTIFTTNPTINNHIVDSSNIIQCCLATLSTLSTDSLKDILLYLFCVYDLVAISKELNIPKITQRTTKECAASSILELCRKLHTIKSCPKSLLSVCNLQKQWRQNKQVSVSIKDANNDVDPFTQISISEIPTNELFSYKDHKGLVWAFSAPDMHYYVLVESAINPFTREPIPDKDLRRLFMIMSTIPEKQKEFSLDSCTNVGQMFTYVLGFYERQGFYLKNEWFTTLQNDEISTIGHFFNSLIDNHRQLADLMISLAFEHDAIRFARMCMLLVCVSRFHKEMEEALPDWIFEALGYT